MVEAPERIKTNGLGCYGPVDGCLAAEYVRADLYAALEAQIAEAKAVLEKIAGSHWERIGYCQTDIDDVPDLTAEEAMLTARRILSALEA